MKCPTDAILPAEFAKVMELLISSLNILLKEENTQSDQYCFLEERY